MGVPLTHRRPVGDGRAGLLHMATWLPIGHVDGERLETLVPPLTASTACWCANSAMARFWPARPTRPEATSPSGRVHLARRARTTGTGGYPFSHAHALDLEGMRRCLVQD